MIPTDYRKGIAAVVGMFAFLSAFLLGPRLLAASIADPTWLILVGIIVTAGVLGRKHIASFVRSMQSPPDSRP
jgi:hypothetical protein